MERRACSLRPLRTSHQRRFGGNEDKDQERRLAKLALPRTTSERTHGKEPLQGKWHSPSPLIIPFVVAIRGGGDNDATYGPGHLQTSRPGTSKGKWDDLGGVCRGVCNGEPPRDTFQRLSDRQDLK